MQIYFDGNDDSRKNIRRRWIRRGKINCFFVVVSLRIKSKSSEWSEEQGNRVGVIGELGNDFFFNAVFSV